MSLPVYREFLTWIRSAEQLPLIDQFGNKCSVICLFWWDIQSDGSIIPAIAQLDEAMEQARQIHQKWPHIRWLLTLKNDGIMSRITPIIRNESGEQDHFIDSVHQLLDQYSWVDGIDADFERLPNDQVDKIYQLYDRLYFEIKGRSTNRWLHLDLPPMEGPYETIGPEKWCAYERLKDRCDTAQIMTYGYAWAGSAPGSTSPLEWQRRVMRYAVRALNPQQVYMGVPAYGYRWIISDYPKNMERAYRGYGGAFADFLRWMLGDLSHTDSYRGGAETQPYIPFFSFYDEKDAVHQLYLHVYDYVEAGKDEDTTNLASGTYEGKSFLTAYEQFQKTSFDGILVDRSVADVNQVKGAMIKGSNYISPRKPATGEMEGSAQWVFTVPQSGTYDLVAQVQFPWFDQQKLHIKMDGISYSIGNVPQHYPYHRVVHWFHIARVSLQAGTHTLEVLGEGSQYGTLFYGFRLCQKYQEKREAGQATFTLHPRKFIDRDGNEAWPHENKMKLTLETVRRPPEPALIFYDDFRDWENQLPTDKYVISSGSWRVQKDQEDPSPRPYSWVNGSGQFTLTRAQFENVTVDANVSIHGNGKAGIHFGDIWFCINMGYLGGRYEVYQGNQLLAYRWPNGNLERNQFYRVKMRIRENEITCYLNNTTVIRHSLDAPVGRATWGIKSDVSMTCDLLVGADSKWYYPQEAIEVTLPDQNVYTLGRIPRQEVSWDEKWGFFYLDHGEEYDTRLEPTDGMAKDISMDWDYLHTPVFSLVEGDYPIVIKMKDQGVWLSNLYLGDADGFSIAVFPFAETILKQLDIATYEFRVRGVGLWAVGQEDPQLWHMLIDQID